MLEIVIAGPHGPVDRPTSCPSLPTPLRSAHRGGPSTPLRSARWSALPTRPVRRLTDAVDLTVTKIRADPARLRAHPVACPGSAPHARRVSDDGDGPVAVPLETKEPSMSTVRSQIERHPLPTFFAATLGFGWLLTIAAAALSSNPLVLPLIAIPISFVPAVMAWLVLRIAGTADERRHGVTA